MRKRPPAFAGNTGGLITMPVAPERRRGDFPGCRFHPRWEWISDIPVPPVGNADSGNLPSLCHGNSLRFGDKAFVRQLVACDSAAFLHKPNDAFCVRFGLGNLIQCILDKIVSVAPFACSVCSGEGNMQLSSPRNSERDAQISILRDDMERLCSGCLGPGR